MSNKTCGECKHLNRELAFCRKCGAKWMREEQPCCDDFEALKPITNGDRIRQMSNEELAERFAFPCPPLKKHCNGNNEECLICWLNWLNAPAESEGENE